jgi:hypothetical protein
LNVLVSSVSISEKLFIGGDLNRHVGSTRVGFDGVRGGFMYGSRNQEGEGILNFALAYDLIVANTFFRKIVSHLVTLAVVIIIAKSISSSREERIATLA